MRKEMCEQMKVIRKIRKAGEMNGFAVELSEAQVKDYMALKKDVDSVRESVAAIKIEQARQGGMIEAIFNRLNSPVEKERAAGMAWLEMRTLFGSWKGWAIIIFFLMAVALAGDKILQLTGWLPTGI